MSGHCILPHRIQQIHGIPLFLWESMLTNKIKTMCEKAKFNGNETNHSLRASSATSLFDSGVPEIIIQARTGHRSLEALRAFE